jgi:hypothetical protein
MAGVVGPKPAPLPSGRYFRHVVAGGALLDPEEANGVAGAAGYHWRRRKLKEAGKIQIYGGERQGRVTATAIWQEQWGRAIFRAVGERWREAEICGVPYIARPRVFLDVS